MKRNIASIVFGVVLILAVTISIEKTKAGEVNSHANTLAGTWIVQLTANPGGPPPFMALRTYSPGGGLVDISNGSPNARPGHGSWVRTSGREYASTSVGFVFSSAGVFAGTFKVRSTITLSQTGDEFSGPVKNEVFDPNGNLIFTSEATSQGRRIAVEPLD